MQQAGVFNYCLPMTQVIPIYGRGSEFDPRQEAIKVQPVPPRPAGQRPTAVQVCTQASCCCHNLHACGVELTPL